MDEPAPLSLELRTIKKRQRTRTGIVCLALGVVVLAVSVFEFLQPGAVLFGIYALAVALGLCGTGGYLLRKAATSQW